MDFLHRIGCPPEFLAPVDEGYLFGDFGKVYGPVECRIASSCNHHAFFPVHFRIADDVLHAFILKLSQVFEGGLARFERSKPTGYGQYRRLQDAALAGPQSEVPIFETLQGFGALTQGEAGLEGRNLLHEALDQVPREYAGVAGDIVDGLFGINLRELPSGLS